MAAKRPEPKKTKATTSSIRDAVQRKSGTTSTGAKVAKAITKRVGTVAREARDVVTAAGTVANTRITSPKVSKMAGENFKKQVREVGSAIKSGKKGTTSDTTTTWNYSTGKNAAGRKVYKQPYTKGKQR